LRRVSTVGGLKIDLDALERASPEQQEKIREQLEALERAFRDNPLLKYNNPQFGVTHEKQLSFHAPRADGSFPSVRAFFGGNRSGKTTAAVLDTIVQVIPKELVPEHLLPFKRWDPPVKVRVVTPDLTNTLDGVIHEKLREWTPKTAFKNRSFDRAWDKVQRILRFECGSWIQFNSSEQEREKLGGVALHRIVYDEEPRLEVRNECAMRLVDYDGEELFALTPFSGMAWMYDQLYEPWEVLQAQGIPDAELERRLDMRVVVVDMDDNPHLSEAGKARQLQKYSGPEREARKSGKFVNFSGRIYPQDPEVVPEIDRVPSGAEVFRGIDPGWRHMLAVVYCFLDFDDNLVVFDEIALRGATVKEACDEMRRRDLRWGYRKEGKGVVPLQVNWTVIDPSSRNKNAQTGRSDQQEFADHGIYTVPGQNAVSAGINRVRERIDARRLQVSANCPELLGQFKRYRWVKETGRGEHEAREQPVKKDDHLLDCLAEGTLISTACGEKPIEQVRAGDLVWTRVGLRRVTDAWCVNPAAEVMRLTTPASELIGTPDHRVLVEGRGWVPLQSVRYGDTMLSCRGLRPSSSEASGSGAIPTRARERLVPITSRGSRITSGALAACMSRCGRRLTDWFRRAVTFTTSTATPSTTTWQISNASLSPITSTVTWMTNGANERARTPRRSATWRSPGTRRRKDSPGIQTTAEKLGRHESRSAASAISAAGSSSRSPVARTTASAPTTARARGGGPRGWMTRIASALSAVRRTGRTGTPRSGPVRVSAAPRPAGTAAVYDLTVDGAHEFFANGLLVHNCLRYVCMQRPLTPVQPKEPEHLTNQQRMLKRHMERIAKLGRRSKVLSSGYGPGQFS
jgi:hypothetical protein